MKLYLNDQEVALAAGKEYTYFTTSFFFGDAEGFSLEVELPLKGCYQNRLFFGYIEKDPPREASWRFRMTADKLNIAGTARLTGVSEDAVRVQLLTHGGAATDSPLDTLYVDSLEMEDHVYLEHVNDFAPSQLFGDYDRLHSEAFQSMLTGGAGSHVRMECEGLPMPWINDSTGALQNGSKQGKDEWDDVTMQMDALSWMPFLLPLTEKILKAAGISSNLTAWRQSPFRNVLLCNAVPARYYGRTYRYRDALPHWTVREYLDNIAIMLGGAFVYGVGATHVEFVPHADRMAKVGTVMIERIIDGHTIDSSFGTEETDCKTPGNVVYRYASSGIKEWNFEDCADTINALGVDRLYKTEADYENAVNSGELTHPFNWDKITYVEETDCYYIPRAVTAIANVYGKQTATTEVRMMEINHFGPSSMQAEEYEELQVLPALTCGKWAEDGAMVPENILLNPDGVTDATATLREGGEAVDDLITAGGAPGFAGAHTEWDYTDGDPLPQTPAVRAIRDNATPDKSAHYDVLYVHPYCNNAPDLSRLMQLRTNHPFGAYPKIDESIKYNFNFLAESIPDVNSFFLIDGHRYVCRRMEVNFNSHRVSSMVKGEFYRVAQLGC